MCVYEYVVIKKNQNLDTRTAPKDVSFKDFQEANDMHRSDVRAVMEQISLMLDAAGIGHDYTKKSMEEMFYNDFLSAMNDGTKFVDGEWYKTHIKAERHHLLSDCPNDVNLIDVMEMIADCVCAGMARSGEVREPEINTEILEKAFKNTVDLIKSMIVVV